MNSPRTTIRSVTTVTVLALLLPSGSPVRARQLAEPLKKSVEVEEVSKRQAFSVVLLLGDMQGGEFLDGVPVAARKALVDTKDFLPYKNYRLLDSQWTLCCSAATAAITRLRGLDDQQYELELRASPILATNARGFEPGALSIRFVLRELFFDPYTPQVKGDGERTKDSSGKTASAAAYDPRVAQVNQELFMLERERTDLSVQAMTLRKQVEIGTKDPGELKRVEAQLALVTQRITTLKNELTWSGSSKSGGASKAAIDASFRMDVGETVVVGTSGLRGGNKALIALLTAVSKPAKGR